MTRDGALNLAQIPGGYAERSETSRPCSPALAGGPARTQSPRAPPPVGPAHPPLGPRPPAPRPARAGSNRYRRGRPRRGPSARAAGPAPAGRVYSSDFGCQRLSGRHPAAHTHTPQCAQASPQLSRDPRGGAPSTLRARLGAASLRGAPLNPSVLCGRTFLFALGRRGGSAGLSGRGVSELAVSPRPALLQAARLSGWCAFC